MLRALVLTVWLLPLAALGETQPGLADLTSPRSAGMAGATRGFASTNEALLTNPAAISWPPRFSFEAAGILDPAFNHQDLSLTALDSKLNADESFALAGAFSYHWYASGKDAARRKGSLFALGLSLPLWPETFFVGVTTKYWALNGAVASKAATVDASVLIKPLPLLSVSAIGYNLIDVHNPEARRSWALGVGVGNDASFHVDADLRLDTDEEDRARPSFAVGAEYLIGGLVMPRAGFNFDQQRNARELAGGVTVLVSSLAIEAFYRHALGAAGQGRCFGLALRILDSPF